MAIQLLSSFAGTGMDQLETALNSVKASGNILEIDSDVDMDVYKTITLDGTHDCKFYCTPANKLEQNGGGLNFIANSVLNTKLISPGIPSGAKTFEVANVAGVSVGNNFFIDMKISLQSGTSQTISIVGIVEAINGNFITMDKSAIIQVREDKLQEHTVSALSSYYYRAFFTTFANLEVRLDDVALVKDTDYTVDTELQNGSGYLFTFTPAITGNLKILDVTDGTIVSFYDSGKLEIYNTSVEVPIAGSGTGAHAIQLEYLVGARINGITYKQNDIQTASVTGGVERTSFSNPRFINNNFCIDTQIDNIITEGGQYTVFNTGRDTVVRNGVFHKGWAPISSHNPNRNTLIEKCKFVSCTDAIDHHAGQETTLKDIELIDTHALNLRCSGVKIENLYVHDLNPLITDPQLWTTIYLQALRNEDTYTNELDNPFNMFAPEKVDFDIDYEFKNVVFEDNEDSAQWEIVCAAGTQISIENFYLPKGNMQLFQAGTEFTIFLRGFFNKVVLRRFWPRVCHHGIITNSEFQELDLSWFFGHRGGFFIDNVLVDSRNNGLAYAISDEHNNNPKIATLKDVRVIRNSSQTLWASDRHIVHSWQLINVTEEVA